MFVLITITTAIAVFSVYMYKKYEHILKLSSKLPGPKGYPLIGNGLLLANKQPDEILKTLHELVKEYGKMYRLWLGPELCLIISDPKDVEVILSSQKMITKSTEYTFLRKWLGDGLLLSTGSKWFSRRKIITPTFHFKILEQFVESFDRQGNIFIEKLEKFKPTDKVDIYPLVTLCALDVICESSMGTCVNAQLNSDSNYVQAVKTIANILFVRMFDYLMRFDIIFNLSSSGRIQTDALKVLHDFTDKVIVARREELLNKPITEINSNEEEYGAKKKMALLDVLLQSTIDGKPLTNMDIREEVDTFMFEGHDTTTSGISFCLYCIAKYPGVQKRVLEEITQVIGDDKKKPATLGNLNDLHYLDLVMKESMRLFPPVPVIGRKILEDTTINNRVYPAGANALIGVYFMGQDPDLYENPEQFIPERFSIERSVETVNPYSYVPFSAGPRNCIGQKFAILDMKAIISKTLRNFEISVADTMEKDPVLVSELILRPKNGIILQFKKR